MTPALYFIGSLLYFFGSYISLYGWGRLIGDNFNTNYSLNNGKFLLLGIFATIFIGQIIHLFYALNEQVSFIWFFSGILFFLYKSYINKNLELRISKVEIALFLLIALILLGFSTQGIRHYDSGLYHIQTIKWLQNEPIVLGIANLHHRLAFNQTYFIFSSMISPFQNPFATQALSNTVISFSIIACLFSKKGWENIYKGKSDFNNVSIFTIIIFSLIIIPAQISSLSPDFMMNAIMLVSFLFYLTYFLDISKDNNTANISFLILLLFLIPTIKLSGLIFSLTALLMIVFKAKHDHRIENRKLIVPLLLGILLLVIYLFRHILFSGCILYPVSYSCLPLDWTPPQHTVQHVEDTITSWARWPKHTKYEALNTYNWLIPWLNRFITNKIIILSLIFSVISIYIINVKLSKSIIKNNLYILTPVITGMLVWLYKAPDIRFASSYFLMLILWFFAVFIISSRKSKNKERKRYIYILLLAFIIPNFIIDTLNKTSIEFAPFSFTPIPITKMKILTTVSGSQILVPITTDQCWDAPLPCTPESEFKRTLKFEKKNIWYIATYDKKK